MERHKIFIVLTKTNTLISRAIQYFTKDEYTHAAISLDSELESMYSFGRKYTLIPFIGRFRKEDINKGIYKYSRELPGKIIEVDITKEQALKARLLLKGFILNKDMYKYNYIGLINCAMNKENVKENRFLCSEFVYYILKECGIADLKMPRNLVRPQSLLEINGKVAYEGDLKVLTAGKNLHLKQFKVGSVIS